MDDETEYEVSLSFVVSRASPLAAAKAFLDVLFDDQPALFYDVKNLDTGVSVSLEVCTTGNLLAPGLDPNHEQEIREFMNIHG